MNKPSRWIMRSLIAVAVYANSFLSYGQTVDPLPESRIEWSGVVEGVTYKLVDTGDLYRVDAPAGKWVRQEKMFQVQEMAAAYRREGDTIYRMNAESGARFAVRNRFREDFEGLSAGVAGLRQLIGIERGWGDLTLQSPQAPTVPEYVALRHRILEQGAGFTDARVAPTHEAAHGGHVCLQCVAPPRGADMVTCKASIACPLVHFAAGDDFWFRAFYFVDDARPHTIMDLECEWLIQHGGIRLIIDQTGRMGVELKALDKPMYHQDQDRAVVFPVGKWVKVQAHFTLSAKPDGIIQVWQDDQLIVDTRGVTLPLARVIYSKLEIGISAHSFGDRPARLLVDDIEVSDRPFGDE